MKNIILTAAAAAALSAANAQVTDTTTVAKDSMMATNTMMDSTRKANTYGSYSTRDSIAAKYKLLPMPGALSQEKIFPVLGTYQITTDAANNNAANPNTTATATTGNSTDVTTTGGTTTPSQLTIVPDSASKGAVWVEGLPQGKVKAYLKKSPTTYRILAQKTDLGTSIPEGTLHFDQTTNVLHIAMGAPYNDADPTAVFAVSAGATPDDNVAEMATAKSKAKAKNAKPKQKVKFITATKVDAAQQMNNNMHTTEQTQQQ